MTTEPPTPLTRDHAIEMLKGGPKGVAEWNEYREAGGEVPDLSGAKFEGLSLVGVNLSEADLRRANFSGSFLQHADLCRCALLGADLSCVELTEAKLQHANLQEAAVDNACLNGADLTQAELTKVDLEASTLVGAILTRSCTRGANLTDTNLKDAQLIAADLSETTFLRTILDGANLSHAMLVESSITDTTLTRTDFTECTWGGTAISSDLSGARNLDTGQHLGPSGISVHAVLSFAEDLPEIFLKGCGLRDEEIAHYRSRVGSRYHSCFISYSTDDEEFASLLYRDFEAAGISCWKWNHDAKTGNRLWREIDQAIKVHDKLVLIVSESSLKSAPVQREIDRALAIEDKQIGNGLPGNVLFPVQIDDYLFVGWEHDRKLDVTSKMVADARKWQDPEVYARVLRKLIKDLQSE